MLWSQVTILNHVIVLSTCQSPDLGPDRPVADYREGMMPVSAQPIPRISNVTNAGVSKLYSVPKISMHITIVTSCSSNATLYMLVVMMQLAPSLSRNAA